MSATYEGIRSGYADLQTATNNDWSYTFTNHDAAKLAVDDLTGNLSALKTNVDALPDVLIRVGTDLARVKESAAIFARNTLPSHPELAARFGQDEDSIAQLEYHLALVKDRFAGFADNRKQVVQLGQFLAGLTGIPDYSQQILPMAYFSGKTVTETIACKDAMSKDQVGDNIIFTAYYESLPHWDVSVGAIGSLLGGRQVGTLTGPYTPAQAAACTAAAAMATSNGTAAPACGPTTVLGYTTKSAYQFMPGVFIEERLKNFHCWGTENGAPWHPFGYLCSIGLAEGVAINPNNGGPAGEFFEGISFGIQRFAILIGFHNGRYQQFGGGYYAGEVFPSGTTVTPPTAVGWATHPAFGIAYRIPPR